MIVIDKDYKYIKSLFHGSACCEELYVYDINGKQIFFGTINLINIENVKINLSRIIEDGQIPITPNFVYEGENINDINWLEQIKSIINKEKAKYYVASFHLEVCSTCLSGTIINKLSELSAKKNNIYYCITILSDRFNLRDLRNMQKILKVNYKLLIADKMLGLRWNELINEFGSNGMTNIIIIADSKGKIVKVFDPSKNDYRKIFEFINKIGDQTYAN